MERVTAGRVDDVLSDAQKTVTTRVLAEEEARREHVVVYLSGAHAYGFPSPDSDLDLKAIHVARTADLLGFDVPAPTVDRAEVIDGVEIDYTSNELAHALSGILGGNGNFIERVLGRMTALTSTWLSELRPLTQRSLSRRVHRHYRGFAMNQLRFLEKEPTAKKLLYVLRTTLTGIHLLESGQLEPDLTRLMDGYGLPEAAALVEHPLIDDDSAAHDDAPVQRRARALLRRARALRRALDDYRSHVERVPRQPDEPELPF